MFSKGIDKVVGFGKQILFLDSSKKEKISIEKVFVDPIGIYIDFINYYYFLLLLEIIIK